MKTYPTTKFGDIDVYDQNVITMEEGLLGWGATQQFTIIQDDLGAPFEWFQSLRTPALAFVVVDPSVLIETYHFAVNKGDIKALRSKSIDDLKVYVVVTMAPDILDVTVNLQGPIIINTKNNLGKQIVLGDPKYSVRHSLFTEDEDSPADLFRQVIAQNKIAQKLSEK